MKRGIYIFQIIILFLFVITFNVTADVTDDPINKIINSVKKNFDKLSGKRIAVIDFTSIDGTTNVKGRILAEQLIAKLLQVKGIKVVERNQLKQILQENELTAAGLTTGDSSDIGKLSAADAILTGTIAELDNNETITAKLLSPKTGEIYCAVNVNIKRKQMQNRILKNLSDDDRKKVLEEFKTEENMKKQNPDRFKAVVAFRKRLLELREKHPELFRKIIFTVRTLEKLKIEHPKLFLLVTAPQNNRTKKYFYALKRKSPDVYRKILRLRKGLKFIVDKSPAYKKKIIFDRRKVLVQLKNGNN